MIELLNLGGGVQSSRLLEESIAGDLPRIDFAIFADTGWEPQTVYDHVDYLTAKAKRAGIPVIRVDGGDLRNDALVAQKAGGVMRQSATDAAAVVEATGIPRRRWVSVLEATLRMALAITDEAYQSTGYFKVAKSSHERVVIQAAIKEFCCPGCDCRSFARPDELKPDGSFGPGLDVLCVGCKRTFKAKGPADAK